MKEVISLTAAEMSALFAAETLSPVEVIHAVLAQYQQTRQQLNALCWVNAEAALQQAAASEARWRSGTARSPLDGVPISIKDNIATDGMPTRFGSLAVGADAARLPDSPAVRRLREAGAVIFGKTTLPDFAHKITTDSPLTGVTCNPWDLGHTPGGSSGGAAAAVASGIGPVAIGSDGGGSIRIPAAFTGIYGFKPSFGRVPHYPRGAFALLSHVGPMTRTAEDAALVMNAIARSDRRDWHALPCQDIDYRAGLRESLKGMRVAMSPSLGLNVAVDPQVQRAIQRVAHTLQALGATVELDDPPGISNCLHIHSVLWSAFSARLAVSLGDAAVRLDPSLQELVLAGRQLPPDSVLNALLARAEVGRQSNDFFAHYDLLLCPVHPTAAPALSKELEATPPLPVFTPWCNQLGLPAASVHAGFTKAGLPIGAHLVGRQFDDLTVLVASHAFQQAFGIAGLATPKQLTDLPQSTKSSSFPTRTADRPRPTT